MTLEQFDKAFYLKQQLDRHIKLLAKLKDFSTLIRPGVFLELKLGERTLQLDQDYTNVALSVLSVEIERQRDLFRMDFEQTINIESPLA